MSLHPTLAHKPKAKGQSMNAWLIAGVGTAAFVIGGLATIGLMQLPTLLKGSEPAPMAAVQAEPIQSVDVVSRNSPPQLLGVAAPQLDTAEPAVADATVIATEATTASIPSATAALSSVEPAAAKNARSREEAIAEAIAIANRNKMRMLTEGVVAGLYTVTVDSAEGEKNRIGLNSINAASAARELENIIAEGASSGTLNVPEAVAKDDGSVDAQTLLFDLVQRSLAKGNDEEIEAAQEMQRRAFAASGAQTDIVDGKRYYVVESGDSLAYISLQFYGSTGAYNQIFEANRDVLESPDKIRIGQRLFIPNV